MEWMPTELQDRYREQWTADLADIPGEISKLFYSLGFIKATIGMAAVEEQTTISGVLKKAFLVRVGLMELRIVSWEKKTEFSGTIHMNFSPISFKEWVRKLWRKLYARKKLKPRPKVPKEFPREPAIP
jgi:hypothetical protein